MQTGVLDAISWPNSEGVQNPPPRPEPESAKSEPSTAGPTSVRGSLSGLFSGDDYPSAALDANEQGSVRVRVEIDRQGRVSSCQVVESSGHSSLDIATCRIVQSRAHFLPARDANGNPVVSSYSQSIKWQIAE
jgi:protein TonB